MRYINYLLLITLSFSVISSCEDDSASNPVFGDSDVPSIFVQWEANMALSVDDTIKINPQVSPGDGVTYKWTFDGTVVSTEKDLAYKVTEPGEFTLTYEIERNGITNSRTSTVLVVKPFEPKEYNKMSIAWLSINGSIADVPWNDITHLILTSSVIQANGSPDLTFGGSTLDISALVSTAHNYGVYILLEYSGVLGSYLNASPAYASYNFYTVAINPDGRKALITTMVNFALASGFDGINIYMDKASESGAFQNTEQLRAFYEEMAAAVPDETSRGNFYLSMSVVSGWTKGALNAVVNTPGYDWVNVLAFNATDLTPIPHAPAWLSNDDSAYWLSMGVLPEQIVIVAPAFGVKYAADLTGISWGNWDSYAQYLGYKAICSQYPDAPSADQITDNGTLFYNGLGTIEAKANLVISQGYAGMALWSVENDSKESGKSLMKKINTSLGN
jgi:PKD repeat protein